MNRIEELIQQLCPDGVEFRDLGDVCKFQRGASITLKDVTNGDVPVIAGGQKPAYYHNTPNRTGETIAISGSGANAGFVSFWTIPIFMSDSFSVNPNNDILTPKYVYYFLKSIQAKIYETKKGGGVPHVHGSNIAKFKIPVPPLPIQQEIVNILDKFTQLEAELEAELEARRAQYNYYRNQLLSATEVDGKWFMNGEEVEWKTLGDVGEFTRGNGLQKKDFTETGVGCIHYGQIYTYYGIFTHKTKSFVSPETAQKLQKVQKNNLIITNTSENIEDVCKTVAWLGDYEIVTGGHATIYKHNENPKYLAYYTQTQMFSLEKRKFAKGAKVIDVSAKDLAKIRIPIPSLSEQERIVRILDKFDALVNDISIGLPAEIKARRKQYEYYRNRLLDFKPVSHG